MDSEEVAIHRNKIRRNRAMHSSAVRMMCQALDRDDVYVQTHSVANGKYTNPELARVVDVYVTEKYLKPFYREIMPRIFQSRNIDIYIFSPPPYPQYFNWWVKEFKQTPGRVLDMDWLLTKLHKDFPPEMPYDYWWEEQFSSQIMKRENQ